VDAGATVRGGDAPTDEELEILMDRTPEGDGRRAAMASLQSGAQATVAEFAGGKAEAAPLSTYMVPTALQMEDGAAAAAAAAADGGSGGGGGGSGGGGGGGGEGSGGDGDEGGGGMSSGAQVLAEMEALAGPVGVCASLNASLPLHETRSKPSFLELNNTR